MTLADLGPLLLTHIIQFTLTLIAILLISHFTVTKWPRLTFLLCVIAIIKCLVPPVVTSPVAVFTLNSSIAHTPVASDSDPAAPERFSADASRDDRNAGDTNTGAGTARSNTQESRDDFGNALTSVVLMVSMTVWCLGVCFLSIMSLQRWKELSRSLNDTTRNIPDWLRLEVASVAGTLRFRRRVRVVITDDSWGPAVVGFIRPHLLIPESLLDESATTIRPIIAHELSHLGRGDTFWGTLQFAAQVIWWFHPGVWLLSRRTTDVCERCCDIDVLNGLKCAPSVYARSLLRVLQIRQTPPLFSTLGQMSARHITAKRLNSLTECRSEERTMTRSLWSIAIMVAAVILPGAAWYETSAGEVGLESEVEAQAIRDAIDRENWTAAVRPLQQAVEENKNNGRAWFFLGYSLHMAGRLEEAIAADKQASRFENYRCTAQYNWACALALQGKPDEAIQKLSDAIDSGFVSDEDIAEDADLKSITSHSRFEELREKALCPSNNQMYRQLDFWIGEWEVRDKKDQVIGRSKITQGEDGFLITEKWTDSQGATGTGISYYDPARKGWKQIWVDAEGNVIHYSGRPGRGAITFTGELTGRNGRTIESRLRLAPSLNGEIVRRVERSGDQGRTWSIHFEGAYRRKSFD